MLRWLRPHVERRRIEKAPHSAGLVQKALHGHVQKIFEDGVDVAVAEMYGAIDLNRRKSHVAQRAVCVGVDCRQRSHPRVLLYIPHLRAELEQCVGRWSVRVRPHPRASQRPEGLDEAVGG